MKRDKTETPTGQSKRTGAFGPVQAVAEKLLSRHGNLVVPALFVFGVVVVYMLGLRAGPRQASADEQQNEMRVQAAITRLDAVDADDGRDAKTVVESFYTDTSRRQVPLDKVARNAFVFDPRGAFGRDWDGDARQRQTDRGMSVSSGLNQALVRAKALRLQSVLLGQETSRALISDTLVSQGEKIAGWTVEEVRPRSVVLTWEGHRFVLEMPQ